MAGERISEEAAIVRTVRRVTDTARAARHPGLPGRGGGQSSGSLWYHGHTVCVSQGLTLSTASLVPFKSLTDI